MFHPEILTRAALALGIILIGVSTYHLYNSALKHRILATNLLEGMGPIHPGSFVLVYFTTPTCLLCKTVQRPAIQKLSQLVGNTLEVIEIDASERPELATRWGVLSVPTTFLINPRRELLHVNHGVARTDQLLLQLHLRDQIS